MKNLVYVDPTLLEGNLLRRATFVKEIGNWVIQSESPKTNNIDEYDQFTKNEVLTMYPELSELFDVEEKIDHTIFFIKINSGQWADFHTKY